MFTKTQDKLVLWAMKEPTWQQKQDQKKRDQKVPEILHIAGTDKSIHNREESEGGQALVEEKTRFHTTHRAEMIQLRLEFQSPEETALNKSAYRALIYCQIRSGQAVTRIYFNQIRKRVSHRC